MSSGGVAESRFSLPHVTIVVGLPSQKLSVGVGFLASASASASRFSLPQVTTVVGGPSSMVFGGASPRLPHPTWLEGGPS